jgi:hypothetical protein
MDLLALNPSQGVSLALSVCLEQGFEPAYGCNTWTDYVTENYGYAEEDLDTDPVDIEEAWECLVEFVDTGKGFASEGMIVSMEVSPTRRNEDYYVIFRISQNGYTRFFRRDGWYGSYSGGCLAEGTDVEVMPRNVMITEWDEVK